jgi:CheY-like chemotaxis protein
MSGSATVLLVEDDPNDVLLTQRAFRKLGVPLDLQIAGDGDAAVAYLSGAGDYADRQRFPLPALVLLDLKLPRRSGLEVLEWRRGRSPLDRIPVVVLTSSRESTDVNTAYQRGANSYLVKPVSFEAMLEMMKTINVYWLVMNERPDLRAGGPAAG